MKFQVRSANQRGVLRGVLGMLTGLGFTACTTGRAESPRVSQARPCSDYTPRVLAASDSFIAYVEAPDIVTTREGTYLLGAPAFAVTEAGTAYRVAGPTGSPFLIGARLDPNGAVTPIPEPTREPMRTPRAVLDPLGRLNLLWVVADSMGTPVADKPIFWSRLDGLRWSPPDSVPRTAGLHIWGETTVSPPTSLGSDLSFVATFGIPSDRSRSISWRGGKWIAGPTPLYQMYLSLAVASDTVVAAYVAYGDPDGNTVFTKRSLDGGKTFGGETRISAPGIGMATDVRILRQARGRLVVIWIADVRGKSSIFAAYSDNGGRSWENSRPFSPNAGIVAMRAETTRTGKVVAIAQVGGFPSVVPTYIEWRDGAWSEPMPVVRQPNSSPGVATIAAPDSVIMAWGEIAPGARRPLTKYIVLPADCVMPRSGKLP